MAKKRVKKVVVGDLTPGTSFEVKGEKCIKLAYDFPFFNAVVVESSKAIPWTIRRFYPNVEVVVCQEETMSK